MWSSQSPAASEETPTMRRKRGTRENTCLERHSPSSGINNVRTGPWRIQDSIFNMVSEIKTDNKIRPRRPLNTSLFIHTLASQHSTHQLRDAVDVDPDVLCLDVAVGHLARVHEAQPIHHAAHGILQLRVTQALPANSAQHYSQRPL